MFKFIASIALLASVAAKSTSSPTTSKVTASIKDTTVDGVEGFNINIAAPFKIQDYIVGFQYKLGDIKKAPESLFAKKSFDTAGDGSATIDAVYNLIDNGLNVLAKWKSNKWGVTVEAEGDTTDRLKTVGFTKSIDLDNNKVTVEGAYDIIKKKTSGSAKVNVDSADVKISYDTESQDPLLEVDYAIDSNNDLSPALSLKSGSLSYGWTRKWTGGSVKSTFFPGDKLAFEWKDSGSSGVWTTKAEVPIENQANTKVSISRDWNY